jgi:dTDP-4-dehydrorhamnose 3,5-epimerase
MPFSFKPTALPGVTIIEPTVFRDDRGFLMETYKKSEFAAAGIDVDFVQENLSQSIAGTLRGLHLQRAPKAQAKLVRVLEGEIFDVAADVRPDSPTYGVWVGAVLSGENRRSIFLPPGYAHAFCVISANAQVLYHTTHEYTPELEWGVRWDDPLLAIRWPCETPRLSERDQRWPFLPERR